MPATIQQGAGKGGVSVCFGRGGDVVAFAVKDRDEPLLPGAAENALQRSQPRRTTGLEKGALGLDHSHQRRYHIQDAQTEFLEGPGHGTERALPVPAANLLR